MSEQFVTIRPSLTRPIEWTMNFDGKVGSDGHFPSVDLPKDTGAHLITFRIDNPDGMEIVFAHDPIWIQRGETCPTSAVIDKNQIKERRRHNATQLVIKDINKGEEQILTYQLNFIDRKDRTHNVTPLDPQIKNGGGTGPGQGFTDNAKLGLVSVAVIAVALIAYRLFVDR